MEQAMEDDDPFFAGDDDFVWPELSSSDELPDNNVVGITMCSVPSTPESASNHHHQVPNLGFSNQEKLNDEAKSSLVVEDVSGEIETAKENKENGGFKANSVRKDSPKLGLVVEDANGELEINRESATKEGFRVNLAPKLTTLEAKSSLKVDDVVEIVKDDDKNKGFRANSMAKASDLQQNLSVIVEDDEEEDDDDDDEVEIIGECRRTEGFRVDLAGKSSKFKAESSLKGEINKGIRVDLAAKDLKLKSKLGESSSLKIGDEKLNKQKNIQEGITTNKVTKASNLRSKLAGKSSSSSMECLTQMLTEMYGIEKRKKGEVVDILRTAKRKGMTFPRNRFLNNS